MVNVLLEVESIAKLSIVFIAHYFKKEEIGLMIKTLGSLSTSIDSIDNEESHIFSKDDFFSFRHLCLKKMSSFSFLHKYGYGFTKLNP